MDTLNTSKAQGERIKAGRQLTLLTRSQFAKKHQINPSSLQAWEDGRYKNGISLKIATQLSEALRYEQIHCLPEWLLEGRGEYPKRTSTGSIQKSIEQYDNPYEKLERQNETHQKNLKMIEAIKKNKLISVKRLIANGANFHQLSGRNVFPYNTRQDTALHVAAGFAGEEIIKLLIELGTYINIRNRHIDAPLHIACLENNTKGVTALIKLSANIEAGAREGATPLIWASYLGHLECCKLLIGAGANINNTDLQGSTALHWACQNDQPQIIRCLHQHGANPTILNEDKESPLDWAIKCGRRSAMEEILKYL